MPLTMNARAWVATSRSLNLKVKKSKSGSPSEVKPINLPECMSKTSLPLIFFSSNTKMTYKAAPLGCVWGKEELVSWTLPLIVLTKEGA